MISFFSHRDHDGFLSFWKTRACIRQCDVLCSRNKLSTYIRDPCSPPLSLPNHPIRAFCSHHTTPLSFRPYIHGLGLFFALVGLIVLSQATLWRSALYKPYHPINILHSILSEYSIIAVLRPTRGKHLDGALVRLSTFVAHSTSVCRPFGGFFSDVGTNSFILL